MRMIILVATSALALAACTPSDPADGAAKPADDAAGHNMAAMDNSMKASDSADDASTAETPEGHTFHSYPAKAETVHLPAASDGGVWTATVSDAALLEIGEQKDETMPDGAVHHTVKVTPKASGNATVTFERRGTAVADAPVLETRTIKFMIH